MGSDAEQVGKAPATRMFALIRRDFRRYMLLESDGGKLGLISVLRIVLDNPGMQAIAVYRLSSWVNRKIRFVLLRYPVKLICYVLQKLQVVLWGIYIDEGAEIGGGFYIGHFGGIIIGPVKMGQDCNVGPHVVIGRRAGANPGTPTIGDRVWIGTGSIVFGGIKVGNGVTIGPLTVVGRNLPERVLVMGNPMQLLRKNYDNSPEIYGDRGMDLAKDQE